MKLLATDVMERENRLHKEYNLNLQTEYIALKTQYTALQQQLSELSASHYSECKALSNETSDLRAQLKMSLYENTILSTSLDSKNSSYQQCKIELEAQIEENRAIRTTLSQLEVQYYTNVTELENTNRKTIQQLKQYSDLETCIDNGIMNVAEASQSNNNNLVNEKMESLNKLMNTITMNILNNDDKNNNTIKSVTSTIKNINSLINNENNSVVSLAAYQRRLTHRYNNNFLFLNFKFLYFYIFMFSYIYV